MQTSQVTNAANPVNAPSGGTRQSDADSAAEPFGKVLSREVSERSAANEAPRRQESARSASQAQPAKPAAKPAEGKSGKESTAADATESKDDAADTPAALPEDMLAFVANLVQLNTPADKSADKPELKADGKDGDKAADVTAIAAAPDAALAAQAAAISAQATPADVKPVVTDVIARGPAHRGGASAAALSDLAVKADATGSAKPELPAGQIQAAAAVTSEDLAAQTLQAAPAGARDFAADLKETLSAATSGMQPVQQAAVHAVQQQTGAVATDKLTPRVGTPAWDQALGQKVVWMVAGEQQTASLTLNPPDLGPLQVVLNVTNSQANATFIAAQPEVRQALEAAMPKLRDMLGEAGIQLGQASVNSGTPNQQGGFDQQGTQQARGHDRVGGRDAGTPEPAVRTSRVQPSSSGLGMVDTFA
ncbi:MAG TPA: flagellar hook-length control protein FliK [Noviherbaspirillum sp.]|uniref:flagellar hook-length control protein FliK n=1 Tax=Noviherbaspirillum sp. TaxID=1926288 RepID=UPI002D2C02F9|nr:flagellar hook-length control protein FliK [Noviherbaspirillum sp.]HYD95698.1 flagellar hook-length control protein FliK [Noviherbaspirillum sp.]